MSVDILGTCWDQCLSMVQYCFTSTETGRLVRTDSQDSHLDSHTAPELWCKTALAIISTYTGPTEGSDFRGDWPRWSERLKAAAAATSSVKQFQSLIVLGGKKGEFPIVCTCLLHGIQKKILVRQRLDTTLCLIKCFGVTWLKWGWFCKQCKNYYLSMKLILDFKPLTVLVRWGGGGGGKQLPAPPAHHPIRKKQPPHTPPPHTHTTTVTLTHWHNLKHPERKKEKTHH